MIAYLKGTLVQKTPSKITIDVGGVGYCVWIPLSTYIALSETNETIELFIHTHMTDSSLALYGFSSDEQRQIFLKLIGISGIGPKIALNILSGIETTDLEEAIQQSDVARISLIPGIGKKTAMRIALELQEKLEKKEQVFETHSIKEKEDLISALMNMGFKRKEVERIVEAAIKANPAESGFEILLRDSLRRLSKV